MTAMIGDSTSQDWSEISAPTRLSSEPVVSVLMLVYNHGRYLAAAIEGVLAQETRFPIELLIGEDCSTDDSREIALRYQRQHPDIIRVITSDANVGFLKNWQRLMVAARGHYLAHHDGDDYWLPGKLERQVEFLRENPNCAAVYTNAFTVAEDGTPIGVFNDVGDALFDLSAMLRRGNFLNTSSMVFRTPLRQTLLEIDTPFIDYMVHLRHARTGMLAHLAQPLVGYRVGSGGSLVLHSNAAVRQLYWEAILDVPRALVSDIDFAKGLADFLRRVFFRALRTRCWKLLREWAPRVFVASPFGAIRTSYFFLLAVVRAVWIEVVGTLRAKAGGRYVPVLYRR